MTPLDSIFTSESVSEGHPDKVCDQLSDAVLDSCLQQDRFSRVACEALVKNDDVVLAGEITSSAEIDFDKLVRSVVADIGYTDPAIGFDAKSLKLSKLISQQSQDISAGVTEGQGLFDGQGAGDQGLMFGFACDETKELMPLPISLSHALIRKITDCRKSRKVDYLRPDAKSQVSIQYRDGKPVEVTTVVLSTQHTDDVSTETLTEFIIDEVIRGTIPPQYLTKNTRFLVNPTGRFVIGGPVGDCGLTGRKIIVDTYGGFARHGGGAFSGKDPSKVDRSAAYAARHIAKNIVAAGLATKCEVQVAYAIGVPEPVSIAVDTFKTGLVPNQRIGEAIREVFRLTPKGIIDELDMLKPIYRRTSTGGHFGRPATEDGGFSWERTDRANDLKRVASA